MAPALEDELCEIVGHSHVLTDAAARASYEIDWTRRFGAAGRLVVRPGSTDEVARVVRACASAGAAVVPQGGNTGLVGASVPRGGEVVLSLRRLDEVAPGPADSARVVVGAGVTLSRVHQTAARLGREFGIDMAARDSATIGGMIATNAGGTRVIRHGTMRSQVTGIEAVLADGSVVTRMSGLMHDNAGYDLAGLLVGSEGTLAIITRASLRLIAPRGAVAVAIVGVPDTAAALLVAAAARATATVEALEVFYAPGLALVCATTDLRPPLTPGCAAYVLIEASGPGAAVALERLVHASGALDAAIGETADECRRLWAYRDRHAEAIAAVGVPHKLDVALPLERLAGFVDAVAPAVLQLAPGASPVIFGHLGIGNLHVNVLGLAPDDHRVDNAVLALAADLGGSVGAEHGIGIAKAHWLALTRSPADVAAMRAIKRALDPAGLLNPGVLFGETP
ncbi:MAG: FAD-binding oxidoreductase [Mycobacteriales bacterium]